MKINFPSPESRAKKKKINFISQRPQMIFPLNNLVAQFDRVAGPVNIKATAKHQSQIQWLMNLMQNNIQVYL